jgi:hypothetical protein
MRKYFLINILFATSLLSFSQIPNKTLRHKIDSLRHVLPNLKDSARVDCLIKLAEIYDNVFADKKSRDSSYACALEAYDISKRMGYKKGLAYALVQMASEQTLKIDEAFYPNQKIDDAIRKMIDSCEYYSNKAIRIGEDINNNDILGSAYWTLASLVFSKNGYEIKDKKENEDAERFLLKSIPYYEKENDEASLGNVSRDLFYVYNDRKDKKKTDEYVDKTLSHLLKAGNDRLLGDFYYFNLRPLHKDRNDLSAQENDLKKAVYYYTRAEDVQKLGMAYNMLLTVYQRTASLHEIEEILKDAISHFQKTGNEEGEYNISTLLSWHYISTGDFEKGFLYCEKSIKLAEKLSAGNNKKQAIWGTSYFYMSRLYRYAGDYETALFYLYKCKKLYTEFTPIGNADAEIGDMHRILKNYDSAMYYLKPFDTIKRSSSTAFGISNLGNLFIDLKEYDKAIPLIKESIKIVAKTGNSPGGFNYTALGKAYLGKKNYQEALRSAREAHSILKVEVHKIRMMENYELLSQIFHSLKKNDSAYYYLQQYTSLKDSLLTRQFYWRLSNYKKVADDEKKISQINLLNKDNQLKEQKLKQQAFVKRSLITGLVILFLLSLVVLRVLVLRRKNEKLKSDNIQSELKQKALELEMQALRAQMNPHFIFNCLSSINRFIIKNETEAASDYLTRFSRLIRMVLINSQRLLITLEDELEMLKLYLDMERLRFKNSFDYNIHFKNTVDTGAISVPPLLFQPFCENAIWHGLMHKEGQGQLDISINMVEKILHCEITDNGVGRKKAAALRSRSAEKEKSLGLKITKERLALFNKDNGADTFYEIEDLYNENNEAAGTKIKLQIQYRETVEELH